MDLEKKNDKEIPKLQEGGIILKPMLYPIGREDNGIPLPIGYGEENNKILKLIMEELKTWGIKKK